MPTPDKMYHYNISVTFFSMGRGLKAFLSQRKFEDLVLLGINIFRMVFFYFLLQ